MFSSLQGKLLGPICAAIIVGLTTLTSITYMQSSKALTESIEHDASSTLDSMADMAGSLIKFAVTDVEMQSRQTAVMKVLDELPAVNTPAYKFLLERLKYTESKQDMYQNLGVIGLDGTMIINSRENLIGQDFRNRSYYKESINNKPFITEPLKSANGNIIVLSHPIHKGNVDSGQVIGVFMASIDIEAYANAYVKEQKIATNGKATLLDPKSGLYLYHFNPSLIINEATKNFKEVQIMRQTNKGIFDYEDNGVTKRILFTTDPVTGWKFAMVVEKSDLLADVIDIRNSSIAIALITLFAVSFIVFLVVRNIVAALQKGVHFAQGVADGNLTQHLDVVRNDEIGTLSDALRRMLESLRNMINTSEQKTKEAEEQSNLAKIAVKEADEAKAKAETAKRDGMLQAAGQLESIVAEAIASSNLLSNRIKSASDGSSRQLQRTTEAATAMEQMNATVFDVARNATQAAASSENTKNNAQEGAKVVANVVKAINEVDKKTTVLTASLNQLGERAQAIGQIMNVITDIADQTNLLALNAAIEAARAGEAGRGFAVVADEVRKLAEKTMTATKEVGSAVQAIQQGTQENIKGMEQASVAVHSSTELAEVAGESLKNIVGIADSTADQVRSIAAASEEQSAASDEINRGTDEINRIAEENAILMSESSDAVTALLDATHRIENIIEDLKRS